MSLVAIAGCKTDQEKLVGTWEMDCVGMVERLNGAPVPDKVAMCQRKLGITIVLAEDGGFSFTSRGRLHQTGTWKLAGEELVWETEAGKPTRQRYEVGADDLFLESPVTGAILVMKRVGPGVLGPAEKDADSPSRPVSPADRIGMAVAEALRTRDVGPLAAIKPAGMSEELAAELARTREVALVGTFGELLEALEADGVDFESAEYDRIELDPGSGTSIIGGGDVHLRCKDRRFYVSVSWSDSGQGPAVVGLSRWYKAVD